MEELLAWSIRVLIAGAEDMGAVLPTLSSQDRIQDGSTTLVGTRSVAEAELKERLLSLKLYIQQGSHEALDRVRPCQNFRGFLRSTARRSSNNSHHHPILVLDHSDLDPSL